MSESFRPRLNPGICARICEAITYLEVPPESLMLEALADLEQQCRARKSGIERDMAETYAEGMAALSRILMDISDLNNEPDGDYFKRRDNKEKNHD
ncbi:MAG: hypothetical protein ACRBB4_15675 [Neptuniibacter sp.]